MSAAEGPGGGPLEAARSAIAAILEDQQINSLFGAPVDTTLLPDYLDIVDNPKDLGTIVYDIDRKRYKHAHDVYSVVQLVWENCLKYNDRPEDEDIIAICNFASQRFHEEWAKAGLERGPRSHAAPQSSAGDEPSYGKPAFDRGTRTETTERCTYHFHCADTLAHHHPPTLSHVNPTPCPPPTPCYNRGSPPPPSHELRNRLSKRPRHPPPPHRPPSRTSILSSSHQPRRSHNHRPPRSSTGRRTLFGGNRRSQPQSFPSPTTHRRLVGRVLHY